MPSGACWGRSGAVILCTTMVDIHCYILPGIDDEATSWEMSATICRVAAQDGITNIVATPHAN
jgi:protein-tyrosine phosphatase